MSKDFSLEMRLVRKKAGLTQKDVAHLLAVKQSTVSEIEKGRRILTVRELIKLSLVYGNSFKHPHAKLAHEVIHDLHARLETLPREVRNCASTFNRADTLASLKGRLVAELKECDAPC